VVVNYRCVEGGRKSDVQVAIVLEGVTWQRGRSINSVVNTRTTNSAVDSNAKWGWVIQGNVDGRGVKIGCEIVRIND
jgi:hypothetical protein